MKVIVDGECFAVSGLVVTSPDDRPEKCEDWDAEFGSGNGFSEAVNLSDLMTEVEDQKSINSCTANAVAGAYEFLCNVRAKQTNDEAGDISRLFIYYVARKYDQWRNGQALLAVRDKGSSIVGAINALIKKGACLEDTYPYDLAHVNHPPPAETYDEALNYKISMAMKVRTDADEFKAVLSQGYPIIFGCKLTEAFHRSKGLGIIPTPDPSDERAAEHGLHAMLIVGYNESQKVFIVRNSWGEGWGDGGYCLMPYDYIANPEFNLDSNYVIRGLTNYDFTPDEVECGELPTFDDEEREKSAEVEIEIVEEESDEDEVEDEEDFDPDEFFSALAEAKKVFDKFDLDGSGRMDMKDLATALKMNGHFVTDEIIEGIMEDHDEGTLGFVELLQILGIEVPGADEEENEEEDCEEGQEEECDEKEEKNEEEDVANEEEEGYDKDYKNDE
jgi:C1A family cysteine protease